MGGAKRSPSAPGLLLLLTANEQREQQRVTDLPPPPPPRAAAASSGGCGCCCCHFSLPFPAVSSPIIGCTVAAVAVGHGSLVGEQRRLHDSCQRSWPLKANRMCRCQSAPGTSCKQQGRQSRRLETSVCVAERRSLAQRTHSTATHGLPRRTRLLGSLKYSRSFSSSSGGTCRFRDDADALHFSFPCAWWHRGRAGVPTPQAHTRRRGGSGSRAGGLACTETEHAATANAPAPSVSPSSPDSPRGLGRLPSWTLSPSEGLPSAQATAGSPARPARACVRSADTLGARPPPLHVGRHPRT